MIYKKFRLLIIIRIILLILSVFLLFKLADYKQFIVSTIIISVLIILQILSLIRYVERTNKKLSKFLESIRHSDFTSSFSDKGSGKSFEKLNDEFNKIIIEFNKHRSEKEESFNYLQTAVQHVSTGIISFTKNGDVDLYNTAVKRLLKINNLRNINELKKVREDIPEILLNMKAGNKTLLKLIIDDDILQLSIIATEFRMRGDEYTLISLQNIHTELEEKEIESWQKLIRVLTHEIMNSITPISSLASTIKDLVLINVNGKTKLNTIEDDDIESVEAAMNTIQRRSDGLLNFVKTYRDLTRIPKPNFRHFEIKDLFEKSSDLLKPKMEKNNILCSIKVFPEDLKLTADPDLIEQVVINLILNSIDAVKNVENPKISILAFENLNKRITIDFIDNGIGIKSDILDKIFMPFFTSKKEGSGIGLSLARQIMHLHKGTISVKSTPEKGTTFTLTF
ncbi:MAG: hypothetical protein K8R41_10420 [Bacteroidales bacterium]|nr:hypothetical protein [Bacteroidales bacterium]